MSEMIARYQVEEKILLLRGLKVMLSGDLASFYGIEVKFLNRAVKRNRDRFPADFMFQLNAKEIANLKYHFGTSSWGGARRDLPYAFTELGVAMLSSVLRSKKAIRVNIEIMRAFSKLREMLATNKDFKRRLEELERKFNAHDHQFQVVFEAIREMMRVPEKPKRKIGFTAEEKRAVYKA
jgi:hypothetical protein